ncbi:MAG: MBL fold metallo-hydrolase [Candidatus Micrarchaeota archaeon]
MRLDTAGVLHFGECELSLDCARTRDCFVSHAHSDHISALRYKNKRILASDETLALAGRGKEIERLELDGGIEFELLESGHILGSKQLLVRENGTSFVYTGDFRLRAGLTTKEAEVRECDILLIEGTYGTPDSVFPAREEIYESIAGWVKINIERGRVVLLGGYSTGKAQELIKLLNERCGLAPLVHSRIHEICSVYDSFGVHLECVPLDSDEARELMGKSFAAVMPHHTVSAEMAANLGEIYGKKVVCALATGWANSRAYSVDKVFPLSDHADFKQILEYVERASPKRIFCCHGNEEALARELRKRGYEARAMEEAHAQLTLDGFDK